MKRLTLVPALIVSIAVTACGQNASVTRIGAPNAQPGQSNEQPKPPGPPGSDERNGRDGKDGRDGRDGRDGCGVSAYTAAFEARPLKQTELSKLVLPYRSTSGRSGHKIPVLNIGQMTGMSPGGVPYVLDSQVVFGVDLHLPPAQTVKSVDSARVEMSVLKLSHDGYPGTELFCFLDSRICSGTRFEATSWQANFNPAFWNGSKPANKIFSDQILGNVVGKAAGGTLWANEALSVSIEDLVAGSELKSAQAVLYGDAPADQRVNRMLPMVVADDSMVRSARVSIELQVDTCVSHFLTR